MNLFVVVLAFLYNLMLRFNTITPSIVNHCKPEWDDGFGARYTTVMKNFALN